MSDDYASGEGPYQGPYGGTYQDGDGLAGGGPAGVPDDRFAPGEGVWQPLAPGGEFDAEATMSTSFTGTLPDFAALRDGADPLAAPGQGFVPQAQLPAQTSYDSAPPLAAGAQWEPADPSAMPIPGSETAEQWSVPFAPEDPAEASGEYSVSQMIAAPQDPPVPFEQPSPPPPEPEAAEAAEPAVAEEAGQPHEEPGELGELLDPHSEHPTSSYVLTVNGADRPVTDAWLGESLLYVLRERLGLAGAKDGCEQGECGACSVQVDGRLVASCLMPAATAAGCEVRTVEGLARDGRPSDVQRALAECGAVQCGFCVPGLAMTVHDLLEGNHRPTELETRQALSGNLCRCSGYQGVLDAVREVAAEREAAAEAADPGHEARIPHQSTGDPDGASS